MSVQAPTDYLQIFTPSDIRLKGTRIGIETILHEYLERGQSADAIAQTYPSLSLEQVYAVILYYLQEPETISEYMRTWREHGQKMREQQRLNPPSVPEKLRELRTQRQTKEA